MTEKVDTELVADCAQTRRARLAVLGCGIIALLALAQVGYVFLWAGSYSENAPSADSVAVRLLQDMLDYNGRAVEVAAWARRHGTDPAVREMAATVEASIVRDVSEMRAVLHQWERRRTADGTSYG